MKRINCRNQKYKPFDYFMYNKREETKEEIIVEEDIEESGEELLKQPVNQLKQLIFEDSKENKVKTNYIKCSNVSCETLENATNTQLLHKIQDALLSDLIESKIKRDKFEILYENDNELLCEEKLQRKIQDCERDDTKYQEE